MTFNYEKAFSRNIGWVSTEEQARLRGAKVAIAGLGGVGGAHLLTLARLGIGHVHLAEFDTFEIHNFNRQVGASMETLNRPKLEVMVEAAEAINPEITITRFPKGVTEENIDAFLHGVDVYVDGIDFFALDARRLVFAACHRLGIPAITAAPLGMGASFLMFHPDGMSFESYFQLEGHDRHEQLIRFMAGLSPAMLHKDYLIVPEAANFREERGPSTIMACNLCAGIIGTEVMKLVLGRGKLRYAPRGFHFDAYLQRFATTWRPGGNAHPMQRLILRIIRARLGA